MKFAYWFRQFAHALFQISFLKAQKINYLKQANQQENVLGLVPRKMVKFNPGLSQVLRKVLCKNM